MTKYNDPLNTTHSHLIIICSVMESVILIVCFCLCVFLCRDRFKQLADEGVGLSVATTSITRDLAWRSQALLCRHPQAALAQALGLPDDIVDEIVVNYVGLFACHRPYREVSRHHHYHTDDDLTTFVMILCLMSS